MKRLPVRPFAPHSGLFLLDLGPDYVGITYRDWSRHHITGAEYP